MKIVNVSIPCSMWVDTNVEVYDDADRDEIFDIAKRRLSNWDEMKRGIRSVVPYKGIKITDMETHSVYDCSWLMEIEH